MKQGAMRLVGGVLLVAGTTIGAGMLALPVTTGLAGFFPSLLLFLVVWFFMTYTAFLMLEVNFATGEHTNMVTMARRTLGPVGEGIAWLAYLLLLYCVMAAYISGCGALLAEAVDLIWPGALPDWAGSIPFVVLFGFLIYLGVKPVDYLNRLLMTLLVVCYLIVVGMVAPKVEITLLVRSFLPWVVVPLSVVVTSFGFHIILPTLADYLDRDLKRMRLCLWIGSTVPLVVYIIWQLVILGVIPLGSSDGLLVMRRSGQAATVLTIALAHLTGSKVLGVVMGIFSFVVILTSFLGVSLSLADFFADGLRVKSSSRGRLLVTLLTFVPPLVFAILYPEGFVVALSFGGIFVAILLGILPICMAWVLRRREGEKMPFQTFGGVSLLGVALLFFVAVVVIHFFQDAIATDAMKSLRMSR